MNLKNNILHRSFCNNIAPLFEFITKAISAGCSIEGTTICTNRDGKRFMNTLHRSDIIGITEQLEYGTEHSWKIVFDIDTETSSKIISSDWSRHGKDLYYGTIHEAAHKYLKHDRCLMWVVERKSHGFRNRPG
eukprot:329650_1